MTTGSIRFWRAGLSTLGAARERDVMSARMASLLVVNMMNCMIAGFSR
jgi:hypothetical protein